MREIDIIFVISFLMNPAYKMIEFAIIKKPISLTKFLHCKTNPFYYRKITNPNTNVKINKPDPYS